MAWGRDSFTRLLQEGDDEWNSPADYHGISSAAVPSWAQAWLSALEQ